MAIRKSELYSSLWAGCDELRGSMDASQYKDYVLVILFMKYVSDKGGRLVEIPEGASFSDMVKLKGKPDIGNRMNMIIGALAKANNLSGIITIADFNDDDKLGRGKEKVDRLSNLIVIFEKPELDFSGNRAEGDDLLGDAYEYLMHHFATESGKSKGQFYTPAEISRIMARMIGIERSKSQSETLYDPTCGSGSLLLKAANEAPNGITIYGQENDNATRALAVMNMWLHGNPDVDIVLGNTLSSPQFKDENSWGLKTFDYAVANPPFSYKAWRNGFDPEHDLYERFTGYEIPPRKNGDYAFLLHLLKSLKSKGKGCIVMPLGVLFRGNSEGAIRKGLVNRGYIKGIIGLPPNLFYGTGIAACLIVIDKEGAENRKDIFMIDASRGFIKDGNKNRLREQDIHKIVDTFSNRVEIPGYSRIIPLSEIADPKNDYNLNIPRYIDSREEEDIQDIEAHLRGGIPDYDVENLSPYWDVCPKLRRALFTQGERKGSWKLVVPSTEVRDTIRDHPEFVAYGAVMKEIFDGWRGKTVSFLRTIGKGTRPREVISRTAEDLLRAFMNAKLLDAYDLYQHLMDYWALTMQDDLYEIAADGWEAGNGARRLIRTVKKGGKDVEKEIPGLEGIEGTLIPPELMIRLFYRAERGRIDELEGEIESVRSRMDEISEENGGEEGLLANAADDKGKIGRAGLRKALADLVKRDDDNAGEYDLIAECLGLLDREGEAKDSLKAAYADLEGKVLKRYRALKIDEIKRIVIEEKWMTEIGERIREELEAVGGRLARRVCELAERYETPLPVIEDKAAELSDKVRAHLKRMGIEW